jgi:hypothetical protein
MGGLLLVVIEIKNQWSRDDPAFVVVQIAFLVAASLAYGVAFGIQSSSHFLRLVIGSVLVEFLACGALIATLFRLIMSIYPSSTLAATLFDN